MTRYDVYRAHGLRLGAYLTTVPAEDVEQAEYAVARAYRCDVIAVEATR